MGKMNKVLVIDGIKMDWIGQLVSLLCAFTVVFDHIQYFSYCMWLSLYDYDSDDVKMYNWRGELVDINNHNHTTHGAGGLMFGWAQLLVYVVVIRVVYYNLTGN